MNKLTSNSLFSKHPQSIKSLSYSQGSYGRLLNTLINMDEDERLELINNLPTFNDAVDVVIWLEQ